MRKVVKFLDLKAINKAYRKDLDLAYARVIPPLITELKSRVS